MNPDDRESEVQPGHEPECHGDADLGCTPQTRCRVESSINDAGTAQLYSWGARALFIGPALRLTAHRNAVAVLAVGLDGRFIVADDPECPERGGTACRSALIFPNTLHHLAFRRGRSAFLYVDAASRDLCVLSATVGVRSARAGLHLSCEPLLIEICRALSDGRADLVTLRRRLLSDVLAGDTAAADTKVLRAIRHLNEHASQRPSLAMLARRAHLSPSRFRHVFKDATGVPLRRYRIWIAMGAAMRCLARGSSLTQAAYEAGFSSSAHFSSAFRGMFGVEPSRLLRLGLGRTSLG